MIEVITEVSPDVEPTKLLTQNEETKGPIENNATASKLEPHEEPSGIPMTEFGLAGKNQENVDEDSNNLCQSDRRLLADS